MSVSTGTMGVSATPATDMYNLIAAALTANGNWTETADSPVSAVNAGGGIIVAPVRCWKNDATPNWFLMIEVDDTNARLRIRAAEELGVGGGASNPAQYKVRKFIDGHSSSNSFQLVANNDGTGYGANSDQVMAADNPRNPVLPAVAWTTIATPAGGYTYVYEARNQLLTIATRANSANYYCVVGMLTSLVQSTADDYPLFMITQPYNSYISQATDVAPYQGNAQYSELNGAKASRAPNCGGISGTLWSYIVLPLYGLNYDRFMAAFAVDAWYVPGGGAASIYGAINGGTPHQYFSNPISAPAVLHGSLGHTIDGINLRTFRAYMPDFVAVSSVGTEPSVGDTLTVDGTTYYILGYTYEGTPVTGYVLSPMWRIVLAIKG